jgi:hypothetical protein
VEHGLIDRSFLLLIGKNGSQAYQVSRVLFGSFFTIHFLFLCLTRTKGAHKTLSYKTGKLEFSKVLVQIQHVYQPVKTQIGKSVYSWESKKSVIPKGAKDYLCFPRTPAICQRLPALAPPAVRVLR